MTHTIGPYARTWARGGCSDARRSAPPQARKRWALKTVGRSVRAALVLAACTELRVRGASDVRNRTVMQIDLGWSRGKIDQRRRFRRRVGAEARSRVWRH